MTIDSYIHLQTRRAGKVKGEGVATGHEGDILVRRWNWGVSAQTAMGSVQATARRSYRSLVVVKGTDTASTGLMMRKAGEGQKDFLRITLKGARISGIDVECAGDGDLEETVTVAFTKIEVEYTPQQSSGGRGGAYIFTDEV